MLRIICTLCATALLLLAGCQSKKETLKVAATPVPHAEMLEHIAPVLAAQGITLEIIEIEDYNTPNRALNDGEVAANFFQHIPFMEDQAKAFGFKIESLAKIHIEPMGIYSRRITTLADLRDGAIIAIPSDPTNEARALALLHHAHIITLDDPDNLAATPLNITGNPKHLKFREVDAAMLTRTLEDVDAAAITANFAMQGGLSPIEDALLVEGKDSHYPNIIAIKIGTADDPKIKALKEAMTSDDMRAFIIEKYQGAIIPAF